MTKGSIGASSQRREIILPLHPVSKIIEVLGPLKRRIDDSAIDEDVRHVAYVPLGLEHGPCARALGQLVDDEAELLADVDRGVKGQLLHAEPGALHLWILQILLRQRNRR